MYVTFLRSSSLGSYEWCAHKFFIQTQLGVPDIAGQKASLGTLVHKALELLARRKLSEQNGYQYLEDDEIGHRWPSAQMSPAVALGAAWNHYTCPQRTTHVWTEYHLKDARHHLSNVLKSHYNPLHLDVIAPEQYYDLEVDRRWSNYYYELPNDKRLSGKLRIKGTMDLVCRAGSGVIEYVDWKTGKKFDWKANREKDESAMRNDKQFLLYYYALRRLYPDQVVIFTVYYTVSGGAFTIPFDDSDLFRAETMLEGAFKAIKADESPIWVKPSWKCGICKYEGDGSCEKARGHLIELGFAETIKRYGDLSGLSSYGSGGGRDTPRKA